MIVTALVQARLTSSRLPGKVLQPLGAQHTSLGLMYQRLQQSKRLSRIVFCIPETVENDALAKYIQNDLHVPFVRGSENDVLSRFMDAAQKYPSNFYVRLTADCPFVCPELVDEVVELMETELLDYCSNSDPATFPDGFDVECISERALFWTNLNVSNPHHREHVTYGFKTAQNRPVEFRSANLRHPSGDYSYIRLTLDEQRDLDALRKLYSLLSNAETASQSEIEECYISAGIFDINGMIGRNEGLESSRTQYEELRSVER